MNQTSRPALQAPSTVTHAPKSFLDQAIAETLSRGFDIDAYHVMDRRDDELIAQEVVNGATSGKFVYAFKIAGTPVTGVSVVGARHLAYEYGGLRCVVLSSVEKTGNLWMFRTFPASGKFEVRTERLRDLEDEPDFYEVMLEISDVKTGNSLQITKRETRQERTRDGKIYDKPHYRTVAEAKAFRNGILSLLPQDVILKFKARNLPLAEQKVDIGEDVLAEKRAGVLRFASAAGHKVDRRAVEALTMDQIAGLSEAARTKNAAAFANAALALGVIVEEQSAEKAPEEEPADPAPRQRRTRRSAQTQEPPPEREQEQEPERDADRGPEREPAQQRMQTASSSPDLF